MTWTTDETMFYLNQVPQAQAVFRMPVIGPIARRVAVAASSNAVYARGGRRFGRLFARSGATVYEGVFSGRPVGGKLGASHAMETPLLFPNEDVWARAALVAPDGARSLITAGAGMRAAFAGFVRDWARRVAGRTRTRLARGHAHSPALTTLWMAHDRRQLRDASRAMRARALRSLGDTGPSTTTPTASAILVSVMAGQRGRRSPSSRRYSGAREATAPPNRIG